jgi:methylenetetrahydrofolate dehydrogenase (NADP+)/methenyltetrahydrofolate cyclohydrolase
MTEVIDGKRFAARLREGVARQVQRLEHEHEIRPGLAVVLVGDDPASQVYVRNKISQAREVGMASFPYRLPEATSQAVLLDLIDQLNREPAVHGILVQLPLPPAIDAEAVIEAIDPAKDVDGFHPINVGRLAIGADGMVPCTPLGCLMLLRDRMKASGTALEGLQALVLGRSNIVGKPMAMLLLRESCTVTIAHSRTVDLAQQCARADILVTAVGRPGLIRGDWIKPSATVIDVGINRIDAAGGKTRLVGDVDFDSAIGIAGAITPVPGGVGPMTIACLLRNTVMAAAHQHNLAVTEEGSRR